MASCLGELHVWSIKNQTSIQDEDIGCYSYHDKNEASGTDHPYLDEKAFYTEGRNVTWTLRNKRPDKLKDTLKELEDLLNNHKCLNSKWMSRRWLRLILNNGVVVSLVVSIQTGDVDRIIIDKSLVGKLSAEVASDAIMTESYIAFTYANKARIDYFYFLRRPTADKRLDKILSFEPKLLGLDLPGPVGRRLERRLSSNLHTDVIVCWWSSYTKEAQPWSPMAGEKEKANFVLLTAIGPKFDVLSYTKTDCDPIGIRFSLHQPHQLQTVEQSSVSGGEVRVNNCVYEFNRNKIHKVSITTVSLKSNVLCYDRNVNEDKVLFGCTDGSVVLFDEYKKVTHLTTSSVIPHMIRWHPSGTLAVVSNTRGELQLFDLALNPVMYQLVSENPNAMKTLPIARYLRSPSSIIGMQWSPLVDQMESRMSECNDSLFITLERGPMLLLQLYLGVLNNRVLSPLILVQEYIKHRQIDAAVGLLSGLNWNSEGQMCFACLSAVMNHLLRSTLNAEREGQMERVLGSFYAPIRPLSEVTILEYRDPMSRLARRFFHQLLRCSRFEKAFLLAVDIGAKDLFMDIHYIAKDKGETSLAEAALKKAQHIDAVSLVQENLDEEYTDEESEDSYSDSEEDYEDTLRDAPPRPPKPFSPIRHDRPAMDLPSSSQADIPQSSRTSHSAQAPWQPGYTDMSEGIVRDLESELAAELLDEYTETLTNEQTKDTSSQRPNENSGSKSTVKVIHFGVV